jgi:hypothetical protein
MPPKLVAVSEEEMARGVVTELQRQGWDVYQEVTGGRGERRADIVGVRGPAIMVVECKTSLSLRLLDQLMWWRGYANIIVGAFGGGRVGDAADSLCKATGVGLWSVGANEVSEKIAPRFHRRTWDGLKKSLRPEQRTAEYAQAGSQGGYWTPFRATCRALYEVAKKEPGIPLREALRRIEHHYASEKSAVSALPALIRRGVIAGVRVTDGAPLRVYLDGDTPDRYGQDSIDAAVPLLEGCREGLARQ